MTEKTASVHWEGQGKQGQGRISTETGALKRYPTASPAASRTTGAAPTRGTSGRSTCRVFHNGVFLCVRQGGLATTDVDTMASVRLSRQGDGFVIDHIALTMQATVPASTIRSSRRSPPRPSSIVLCRRHLPAFRI